MSLKITYTHPRFPQGRKFAFRGLDAQLENGVPYTLSDEVVAAFEDLMGKSVKEYFKGMEGIKVENTPKVKLVTTSPKGGEF